jgi:hypothetical protein
MPVFNARRAEAPQLNYPRGIHNLIADVIPDTRRQTFIILPSIASYLWELQQNLSLLPVDKADGKRAGAIFQYRSLGVCRRKIYR